MIVMSPVGPYGDILNNSCLCECHWNIFCMTYLVSSIKTIAGVHHNSGTSMKFCKLLFFIIYIYIFFREKQRETRESRE